MIEDVLKKLRNELFVNIKVSLFKISNPESLRGKSLPEMVDVSASHSQIFDSVIEQKVFASGHLRRSRN